MKWKDWFKGLFKLGPAWIVILVIIIVVIFLNPEKVEYWGSKFLNLFSWIGEKPRKKQVEKTLRSNVLKAVKDSNKEIEEVMPYDIKIEWVKEDRRDTFLEGDKVVLCMDNKRNVTQNIVFAINSFVNTALLPDERTCVDENTHQASCLVMTRKLLLTAYEEGATYFFENILKEATEINSDLKSSVQKLIALDEGGLFVQVMLREIKTRSNEVLWREDNASFIKETENFVGFLYKIAVRKTGDFKTVLDFNKRFYKVGIILVAHYGTYDRYGEDSYIKRFDQHILEGKDSVYLMAKNEKMNIVKKVIKNIKSEKDKSRFNIKEIKYTGRNNMGSQYKGITYHIKLSGI